MTTNLTRNSEKKDVLKTSKEFHENNNIKIQLFLDFRYIKSETLLKLAETATGGVL